MKISEILAAKKTTVSLEVFPPKQWNKLSESKKTVEKLLTYQPDFVSVTYGAAGTTSGYTAEIAEDILNFLDLKLLMIGIDINIPNGNLKKI